MHCSHFFGGSKMYNIGKVWFRIAFHIRKGIAQWIRPPQAELSTIKKRWIINQKGLATTTSGLHFVYVNWRPNVKPRKPNKRPSKSKKGRRADRHRFHSHHRTGEAGLLLTASTKPFPVMQKMPRQDGVFHACRSWWACGYVVVSVKGGVENMYHYSALAPEMTFCLKAWRLAFLERMI